MADTRRELILARMKTNLDAITNATVYRSRVEPLARAETPAIIIEPARNKIVEKKQIVRKFLYTDIYWEYLAKAKIIISLIKFD